MLKKNNFFKISFCLLLVFTLFGISLNINTSTVNASTLSIYEMDPNYETIVFKPTADISAMEIGITFEVDNPNTVIPAIFDYTNNPNYFDNLIEPDGENTTFTIMFPFEYNNFVYEAGKEYCIKFGNADNWYISDVINWDKLGITHVNFKYYRLDDNFKFLGSSCVHARFDYCLDSFYTCSTFYSSFASKCKFEEFSFPQGIEYLYSPVLNNCVNLETVSFYNGPTEIEIENGAPLFLNCTGISIYNFAISNDYYLAGSYPYIFNYKDSILFLGTNSGVIPNDCKIIYNFSFQGLQFNELIIPESVIEIKNDAFMDTFINNLVFTSKQPPIVYEQNEEGFNKITVPYYSYDTYISTSYFNNYSDKIVRAEKPPLGVDLLSSIIVILMGGISSFAIGIGSGLTDLVSSIFISSNGGLSLFGGVIIVFAGLSLAIGLCRLIISFITSLGGDD